MFYETAGGHGLPHDPFKAIVSPRPIGWISTRSLAGAANLAPFSYFNAISDRPYLVMFAAEETSDSPALAKESGEFVVNLAGRALVDQMVASSVDAPRGVSEFGYAGLEEEACRLVAAPRVKGAAAALECKVTEVQEPRDLQGRRSGVILVIGEVVGIHIDDAVLTEGRFDVIKAGNVARLGYLDYLAVTDTFEMHRPTWKD